jgi:hypothetical protein
VRSVVLADRNNELLERIDVAEGSSSEMVPKSAEEKEESSTTTLARLGNDDKLGKDVVSVGAAADSEVVDAACFSARRNGDLVSVGSRRNVDEAERVGRLRPGRR